MRKESEENGTIETGPYKNITWCYSFSLLVSAATVIFSAAGIGCRGRAEDDVVTLVTLAGTAGALLWRGQPDGYSNCCIVWNQDCAKPFQYNKYPSKILQYIGILRNSETYQKTWKHSNDS